MKKEKTYATIFDGVELVKPFYTFGTPAPDAWALDNVKLLTKAPKDGKIAPTIIDELNGRFGEPRDEYDWKDRLRAVAEFVEHAEIIGKWLVVKFNDGDILDEEATLEEWVKEGIAVIPADED